jgi:hypothetical protein
VRTLSPQAVAKLTETRRELLQRQGRDWCEGCSVCVLGDDYQLPAGEPSEEAWVRLITHAVMKNLQGEVETR